MIDLYRANDIWKTYENVIVIYSAKRSNLRAQNWPTSTTNNSVEWRYVKYLPLLRKKVLAVNASEINTSRAKKIDQYDTIQEKKNH